MPSNIKQSLSKVLGATLYIGCATISLLPFHFIRRACLRILGSKIAKDVGLYRGFEVRSPWKLSIGANSIIGHNALLDARSGLTIGENVNLSNEVMIWSLHHDYNDPDFAAIGAPVIIEDYAWLCSRCIILPGVTIGKGAVVAAGAVVSRNVLPYTVVGGIPAKVIASRSSNLTYQLGKGIVPII
jgi:acetyltransferase-like isoleucine patch superfamily enzyme